MFKRLPIIAAPFNLRDILSATRRIFKKGEDLQKELSVCFSALINKKYVFFLNSGIASFFIILKGLLKERCKRDEVILPAYTAPFLIIAIKKARLKPVLCDISLDDFNMDCDLLKSLVSDRTFCILGVHMFGIVMDEMRKLKERFPQVTMVEDCAQGFGGKIDDMPVGNLGDISFFSFNRGKNLSTYGGGCIATNSEAFVGYTKHETKNIKEKGLFFKLFLPFKLLALYLATKQNLYAGLWPLAFLFKDIRPAKDFQVSKYTELQAAVALSILEKIEKLNRIRYLNGMRLIDRLKEIRGVIVPKIASNTEPAFNRLPILFKDLDKRKEIEIRLEREGIETSKMYLKPLHHIFELGYKKEDFPNSCYLAEHLLTLPVHPLVKEEDIAYVTKLFESVL